MNFRLMLPRPMSRPVAAPQGPILVRYTHFVMIPCSFFLRSSPRLLKRNHLLTVDSPIAGSESSVCAFVPKNPTGRNCGRANNTSDANENCTTICTHVTNSGKWKLRWSGENIHLLYCVCLVRWDSRAKNEKADSLLISRARRGTCGTAVRCL